MSDQDRVDLLGNLYSIVNDLWGSGQPRPAAPSPAKPAAGAQPMHVRPIPAAGAAEPPAQSQSAPAPAGAPQTAPAPSEGAVSEPAAPKVPPITEYWRTADEPLPWTEALIQPLPRDGLTREETWKFCHELAEDVLSGDTAAYGRVLEKIQPLADLAPYTAELRVKIDSADVLRADFTLTPELSRQEPTTHLCCTAIRIARDLMAALPVTEVALNGQAGSVRLQAVLKREAIRNVRWGFVDAETLMTQLGASIGRQA